MGKFERFWLLHLSVSNVHQQAPEYLSNIFHLPLAHTHSTFSTLQLLAECAFPTCTPQKWSYSTISGTTWSLPKHYKIHFSSSFCECFLYLNASVQELWLRHYISVINWSWPLIKCKSRIIVSIVLIFWLSTWMNDNLYKFMQLSCPNIKKNNQWNRENNNIPLPTKPY